MNVQSGAFLQSQDGSFSHFSLEKNANLCTFGSCNTRFTLGDFYGLSASSATSQSKQRRALTASDRLGRSVLFILFKVSYFGAVAQVRWREVGRSQIGVLLNQRSLCWRLFFFVVVVIVVF